MSPLKFYQNENASLSSELLCMQKKNEITKENLNNIDIEKEKISNKIKESTIRVENKIGTFVKYIRQNV